MTDKVNFEDLSLITRVMIAMGYTGFLISLAILIGVLLK